MKGTKKHGGRGTHAPASAISRMEKAHSPLGSKSSGAHGGIEEAKVRSPKGSGASTFKAGPNDGMLIKPAGKGMK